MKEIKVYGVYDLMEWYATISCANGIKLHVHFEGGSSSVNGIVPAKYKTDNAAIQALIEGSEWFKKGKIKLVRTYRSAVANVASSPAPSPKVAPKVAPLSSPAPSPKVAPKVAPLSSPAPSPLKDDKEDEVNGDKALQVVKVSDLEGEGRNYLKKEFGVRAIDMRGVRAIQAQALAHGIRFEVG